MISSCCCCLAGLFQEGTTLLCRSKCMVTVPCPFTDSWWKSNLVEDLLTVHSRTLFRDRNSWHFLHVSNKWQIEPFWLIYIWERNHLHTLQLCEQWKNVWRHHLLFLRILAGTSGCPFPFPMSHRVSALWSPHTAPLPALPFAAAVHVPFILIFSYI